MSIKSLLSCAFMATAAMGHAVRSRAPQQFACGAPRPSADHIAIGKSMAQAEMDTFRIQSTNSSSSREATINVETYFHVVSASTSPEDGFVTDETLQEQLDVMNKDFAPYGIAFTLRDTSRTVNREWAYDEAEVEMKTALRQGGYDALNVYFQTYASGNLGYAYFPTQVNEGSEQFYRDGAVLLWESVPGGPSPAYALGKTAVHEIGHWFGLEHTFGDGSGCDGEGDSIEDTPAEESPAFGCLVGRDSCPGQFGLDPVRNYMDYSDDDCVEGFSIGQQARMHSMWNTFRI